MSAEMMQQIIELLQSHRATGPSPTEFEMAYQILVAAQQIRFAINHFEASGVDPKLTRIANLQLLEALDRLETAERQFRNRWPHRQRRQVQTICRNNHNAEGRDSV